VLVGFQTRIAAIVLAVFTLAATAVAHLDFSQAGNALMLQKNLGITGGLLLLAVLGAGAYSIDGRKG
jgi:putative oxidoreductase